jgi:glutathione S-transferase
MITVYKFASAWGQPDLSPFVLKLETYLRMAGIDYQGKPGNPRESPKGKLPYLDHDGKRIGDSSFIIEHLKSSFGDKLDAKVAAVERARATAYQAMLEEQLYFVILYERWQMPAGWETYTPILREYLGAAGVPGLLRGAVLGGVRKQVLRSLHAQGTGRHAPAEVEAIGKRIVDSVAEAMGDGSFFMGGEPRSIDATVYAFLSGLLDTPFPSEVKKHAATRSTLRAYVDRMRAKYWA